MIEPNWGNTHADDCQVTISRKELWETFCAQLHTGPGGERDYLWGAIIEHCAGGDEDGEQCDCPTNRGFDEALRIRTQERDYYQARVKELEAKINPHWHDPLWHLKYIKDWAEARLSDSLGDPSHPDVHFEACEAAKYLIDYLNATPNGTETRITHIYG